MAVWQWSQTAASNGNSDPNINFAEGMSPSAVNDSARSMMAQLAKYRDDQAGSILTGGTSTAYTATSNSGFSSLSALNGQTISFTANVTNSGASTLAVDGLAARPLRSAPGVEIPAGVLNQGAPYDALYNSSNGEFYLKNFYVSGASLLSTGDIKCRYGTGSIPGYVRANSKTIGSATSGATELANADCQSLFIYLWNTDSNLAVSSGRGASAAADWAANKTIATPDFRGTFLAGFDDMGASAASRLSGLISVNIGTRGGAVSYTISQANLPNYNITYSGLSISSPNITITDTGHIHGITDPTHTHSYNESANQNTGAGGGGVANDGQFSASVSASSTGITINSHTTGITAALASSPTLSGTLPSGGSGTPMTIFPPVLPVTIYLKL